jgi:hypothetical protein
MQNLKEARVGDVLHVTHRLNMWSGIIEVVSEYPNFGCKFPVFDEPVSAGLRSWFETAYESKGLIELNVESAWKIKVINVQLEND